MRTKGKNKATCILWHIHVDPFLSNDRETNNMTTAVAMQQVRKYATVLEPLLGDGPHAKMETLLEGVFSRRIHSEAIAFDRPSRGS
jgi:hypothetical protein